MTLKYTIRIKMDISVAEDQKIYGGKMIKKNPIGQTLEYSGTPDQILKKIENEFNTTCFKLEDLYYGKGE